MRGAIGHSEGMLSRGLQAMLISRLWCFTASNRGADGPPLRFMARTSGRLNRTVVSTRKWPTLTAERSAAFNSNAIHC